MKEEQFIKILQPLWDAGGIIYEVGGTVRDRLLNRPIKDKDLLVTRLPFAQIKTLLQPFGKIILVGKAFGVLKFTPHLHPEQTFDIALPRKEVSTGTGHRDFEVDYDPNLPVEEDLQRRDFTINAIALELRKGKIIDPFGGQKDIEANLLRQVFPKAFAEDPLRLIRAVQFAARFDLTIETETERAMKEFGPLLKTVSPERQIEEIRKLFLAEHPSRGIELMRQTGLLPLIFPELTALIEIPQDKRPGDDVYQHTLRVLDAARADPYLKNPGDLELLFAALFHDVGKAKTKKFDPAKQRIVFYGHQIVSERICKKWMERMKITTLGVNPSHISTLVTHHMFETKSYFTDKAIRRFIQKIGKDLIEKLLDLRLADNRGGKHPRSIQGVLKMRARVEEILAQKPPFGPGDLAINGHDLMNLGVPEGRKIGYVLKQLVEMVLDDPELNTKEQLLVIAKNLNEEKEK